MKMIISPFSYLLDLIKDLMLMIQFAITQGGLGTIIMQPEAYMLTVSNFHNTPYLKNVSEINLHI